MEKYDIYLLTSILVLINNNIILFYFCYCSAFPVARPVGEVMSPQPVELLSEESSDSRMEPLSRTPPVLLVSGLSNEVLTVSCVGEK